METGEDRRRQAGDWQGRGRRQAETSWKGERRRGETAEMRGTWAARTVCGDSGDDAQIQPQSTAQAARR